MKKVRKKSVISEMFSPMRIELTGNREILVEGHSGIIEYNENLLRLSCKDKILNIIGSSLCISMFSSEYILATGEIESVTFTL